MSGGAKDRLSVRNAQCSREREHTWGSVAELPWNKGPRKLLLSGYGQVPCWMTRSIQTRVPTRPSPSGWRADRVPGSPCSITSEKPAPGRTFFPEPWDITFVSTTPLEPLHVNNTLFLLPLKLPVCLSWPRTDWSSVHYPTHPREPRGHKIRRNWCILSVSLCSSNETSC